MITDFYAIDEVFEKLNSNVDFKNEFKGVIYRLTSPDSQTDEYCVINVLTMVGNQLKEAVLNVNVYVPNLTIQINGRQDSSQPNVNRLRLLNELLEQSLSGVWKPNAYLIDVRSGTTMQDPTKRMHFINKRIDFKKFNITE